MKILLLVLLASFVGAGQERSAQKKGNKLQENSFQFQILDFFKLKDFQGAFISYKYHFSSNNAIRFGVGISLSDTGHDRNSNDNSGSTSSSFSDKDTRNSYTYSVTSQYLFYHRPENKVKFYYGAGPYFSISNNERRDENSSTNSSGSNTYWSSSIEESDLDESRVGATAITGLEWFFNDNMSLMAEYSFKYYFFDQKNKTSRTVRNSSSTTVTTRQTTQNSDGWRLSSGGVKFGLSVYF